MFTSLRKLLISVSALIMVVALSALSMTNLMTVSTSTQKSGYEKIHLLARNYTENIAQWVESKQRVLSSLRPAALSNNLREEVFMVKEAGGFDNVYSGYPDKRFVSVNPPAPNYDPTSRGWYKAVHATKDSIVTEPYIAASTQRLVVTFAMPVLEPNTNNIHAIVGANMEMKSVIDVVSKIKPTPSSYAFLVSKEDLIISHPDDALILKRMSEYLPGIDEETIATMLKDKSHRAVKKDGREYIVIVSPVSLTDWVLVMMVDEKEEMAVVSDLFRTSLLTAVGVAIISVFLLFVVISRSTRRLVMIQDAMVDIVSGEGDLTRRIDVSGRDELSRIAMAFNQFVKKLSGIMVDIRASSESVKVAAQEIATGNMDLSRRTESQAGSLEETASAMEQLTATVKQNADNAGEANRLANTASEVATQGGQVVNDVVSRMERIQESSRKIVDIISVIDGIAFQTNILALNAAVEAARAGEQGRGFAVVASEVRSLAQRSATAAKEIKDLIDHSVSEINEGSQMAQRAGKTMDEVVSGVGSVSAIVNEISMASTEQSQGISNIGEAITDIDQMMQQNAALVEEAAAAASSLQEQADRLAEVVSIFKLDANVRSEKGRVSPERAAAVLPAATVQAPRLSPAKKKQDDDWEEH